MHIWRSSTSQQRRQTFEGIVSATRAVVFYVRVREKDIVFHIFYGALKKTVLLFCRPLRHVFYLFYLYPLVVDFGIHRDTKIDLL